QRYLGSSMKLKLTENEKLITQVYFDLLKESSKNFTKTHILSLVLIEANKKFGWTEFDPLQDAKTISAVQSIKNWSTNSNKLLSVIGNYIDDAPKEKLDADNPLYSGIIDAENIKDQKTSLFKKIQDLDEWKKLNKIDLPKKEVLFNQQTIKVWFEKNENEVEQNSKQLVHDIKRIWNNLYYQERSILINESTFTHDILLSIIHFISPGFFKCWDQAQSLSAKDHGVQKFGDVIGYITRNNKTQFEVLFVEVSYGPFHKDLEPHIDEDKRKLGKL
ncbi:14691_t:CDS:2, partial [Gigaspora margarita]